MPLAVPTTSSHTNSTGRRVLDKKNWHNPRTFSFSLALSVSVAARVAEKNLLEEELAAKKWDCNRITTKTTPQSCALLFPRDSPFPSILAEMSEVLK